MHSGSSALHNQVGRMSGGRSSTSASLGAHPTGPSARGTGAREAPGSCWPQSPPAQRAAGGVGAPLECAPQVAAGWRRSGGLQPATELRPNDTEDARFQNAAQGSSSPIQQSSGGGPLHQQQRLLPPQRRTWNTPEERRSTAGGEKTAWVAQAYTSRAPSACSTLAALVMVPGGG